VLSSFAEIVPAQAPANFTFASHQAFFVGILPNASSPLPYFNRFERQLMGLANAGAVRVAKRARILLSSGRNLIHAFRDSGYATVGTGAMDWFRLAPLRDGFDAFRFTGTDAEQQIDYLLDSVPSDRPFFGFANFGETHAPYDYAGKRSRCPVDVFARRVVWPPREQGPVGRDNAAFAHQVEAAEFLDRQLGRLLSGVPRCTIVVLCADHGDCFGEDGYWGHGFNHPKVLEVPLAIFRLDGEEL
jgi:arylsulfatase A-like enzyme